MKMKKKQFQLLVGAVAIAAGCYNPNIESKTLRCGNPGAKCPEGFFCNIPDGFCYENGVTPGGTGGTGGGGGAGGTGGAGGMCVGPLRNCAPAPVGAACDPVCQSGCRCNERCNVEGAAAVCKPQGGTVADINAECVTAADACRPGLVCLDEATTVCKAHCYKYCRTDADCVMGARCSNTITVNGAATPYKVCGTPVENCDPFPNANGRAPCRGLDRLPPAFGCYVLTPDTATCDCAGSLAVNAPCSEENQCQPGHACVPAAGRTSCRRVCQVGAVALQAGACPAGQVCTPFRPTSPAKYGYCL
jgi:hypothetical protein